MCRTRVVDTDQTDWRSSKVRSFCGVVFLERFSVLVFAQSGEYLFGLGKLVGGGGKKRSPVCGEMGKLRKIGENGDRRDIEKLIKMGI